MGLIGRSPVILVLVAQLVLSVLCPALAISIGSGDGYTINGRVKISGTFSV
uniref:Uncharacterized protein MANES_03G012900 n=1 Tax=Rhizophora mucronata TaxID=61149 RepID=A0A2P2K212_RHIMU